MRTLLTITGLLVAATLFSQKLEIEWDGNREDVIRFMEGGKARFSIEGQTAGVADRITFRVKTEPEDTLVDALTLLEGGMVMLPRITNNRRSNITAQEGMIIYNTDADKFQGFASSAILYESTPVSIFNGGCLSFKIPTLTPIQNESMIAIELFTDPNNSNGNIKVLDGSPCGSPTILGTTSNGVVVGGGWMRYTFNSPVALASGNTYYFQTNSGTVCAQFSEVDDPAMDAIVVMEDPFPFCNPGGKFAIRIIGGGWVNLH